MGVLRARVNNAWVDVLGGANQDAIDTSRWNTAWGVIGEQAIYANSPAYTGASSTDMSLTVSTVAGRVYEIIVIIGTMTLLRGATANSRSQLLLTRNGTGIQRIFDDNIGPASLGDVAGVSFSMTDRPASGGAMTYAVTTNIAAGDSLTMNASGSVPRLIVVRDMGPVSLSSGNAPAAPKAWQSLTTVAPFASLGGIWAPLGYRLIDDMVYIRGAVGTGATAVNASQIIANLPPAAQLASGASILTSQILAWSTASGTPIAARVDVRSDQPAGLWYNSPASGSAGINYLTMNMAYSVLT